MIDDGTVRDRTDRARAGTNQMIADIRSGLAELRCLGNERLLKRGVSVAHLHLLSMLERHGEQPMSRIADLLDVSLSNATGIIDRLEERGYVERRRVPTDRRIVLVRATDEAAQLLAELEILRNDVIAAVLDHLDATQLERLERSLEDLREAIAATIDSHPTLFAHGQGHDQPPPAPFRSAQPAAQRT